MNNKDKKSEDFFESELFKDAFVEATLRKIDKEMEQCEETAEVSDDYKRKMNKMFKDMGSSFVPYPDI